MRRVKKEISCQRKRIKFEKSATLNEEKKKKKMQESLGRFPIFVGRNKECGREWEGT